MRGDKTIKVRCKTCDITFEAKNTIHELHMCPKCKCSGVDYEDEYIRIIGDVEVIDNG